MPPPLPYVYLSNVAVMSLVCLVVPISSPDSVSLILMCDVESWSFCDMHTPTVVARVSLSLCGVLFCSVRGSKELVTLSNCGALCLLPMSTSHI